MTLKGRQGRRRGWAVMIGEVARRGFVDARILALSRALRAVVVAVFLGFVVLYASAMLPTVYTARSTLMAPLTAGVLPTYEGNLVTPPTLDLSVYRAAALSDPVLRDAMGTLGLKGEDRSRLAAFRGTIGVRTEVDRISGLLYIVASSADPATSAARANAVSEALLRWDVSLAHGNLVAATTSLGNKVASLDQKIAALRDRASLSQDARDQLSGLVLLRAQQAVRLDSLLASSNSAFGLMRIVQPASAPLSPSFPRPVLNAAAAFVLSLLVGLVVVLLMDAGERRPRRPEDIYEATGLRLLGEVGYGTASDDAVRVEGSGRLRAELENLTRDKDARVFLITTPESHHVGARVALSLAADLAWHGHRTLLVDADLRQPVIGPALGLHTRRGHTLSAALAAGEPALQSAPMKSDVDGASFDVLPSFSRGFFLTTVAEARLAQALERWSQEYDVVLVNAPPVEPFPDVLTLAPLATGVLLACDFLKTSIEQLKRSVRSLEEAGGRMLGVAAAPDRRVFTASYAPARVPRTGARPAVAHGHGRGRAE